MEQLLDLLARAMIRLVQALPLRWVARLGRGCGAAAYWLDVRHRRMAVQNLTRCFGAEMAPGEIRALARENFRRLGENFASMLRIAAMTPEQVRAVLEFDGAEKLQASQRRGAATNGAATNGAPTFLSASPAASWPKADRNVGAPPSKSPAQNVQSSEVAAHHAPPGSCVVAVGHFGNFELYAHAGLFVPGFRMATTYRALRQPTLDRLFQAVRAQSGCLYFERRAGVVALREAMQRERLMIGFLADQHAGVHGARLPFLGRECSTNVAAAVFALRYHCPLHTAICYRLGLGRWRIEVGDEIPTRERGRPRRVEAIALDINRAFEAAIRREPANWFWVHNRWKSKGRAPRAEGQKPGVESLPAAGSEGAKTRQTR